MVCTLPFSFKVLYSPFVEFYHLPSLGKRRSWIIPTQFILSGMLYYLRMSLEPMLEEKQVGVLAYILLAMVFVITVQDIAVDCWAIEMLHPQNASYGSQCQTIGQQLGIFVSTSIFMSLNSPDFCKSYLYPWLPVADPNQPVLTLSNFMFIWSTFQLCTTVYILLFVPETKRADEGKKVSDSKKDKDVEEEVEPELRQTFAIFADMLTNKNTLTWFSYAALANCACAIPNNIFEVYITNDLGMAKETLSLLRLLFTPLNIALAFISSRLSAKEPFKAIRYSFLGEIFLNAYAIFVIAGTFPPKEEIWTGTILHVSAYMLVLNLVQTFTMVSTFGFFMACTDKRVSGIHVTFLACMFNQTQYFHKWYVFSLVDRFGIFGPQVVLVGVSLLACFFLGEKFQKLDHCPKESWHVSDKTLSKAKK